MTFNDTEYRRKRNEKDPEVHEKRKQASREWKRRHVARMNALVAAAKDKPCADCGQQFEDFLMEFDHVHGVKSFALSKAARAGKTEQEIRDEIAKCEIRCVMCHRRRHWARGDFDLTTSD